MRRPLPCQRSRDSRDALVALRARVGVWLAATGDPRVHALDEILAEVTQMVATLDDELQAECRELLEDPDYELMAEGEIPWPNEPAAAFARATRNQGGT